MKYYVKLKFYVKLQYGHFSIFSKGWNIWSFFTVLRFFSFPLKLPSLRRIVHTHTHTHTLTHTLSLSSQYILLLSLLYCVRASVCVCVWEREREKERTPHSSTFSNDCCKKTHTTNKRKKEKENHDMRTIVNFRLSWHTQS